MRDLGQFLADGGTRIRWGRVTEVGFGTVIGAMFSGIAALVLNLADVPLALIDGFGEFVGSVIAVVLGFPAVLVERGFAEAAAFVVEAGIAGYLVAVGIALATLYVIAGVLDRVE